MRLRRTRSDVPTPVVRRVRYPSRWLRTNARYRPPGTIQPHHRITDDRACPVSTKDRRMRPEYERGGTTSDRDAPRGNPNGYLLAMQRTRTPTRCNRADFVTATRPICPLAPTDNRSQSDPRAERTNHPIWQDRNHRYGPSHPRTSSQPPHTHLSVSGFRPHRSGFRSAPGLHTRARARRRNPSNRSASRTTVGFRSGTTFHFRRRADERS